MVRTYATKIRRPQNEIGKISFNNHVGTIKIGGLIILDFKKYRY